MNTNDRTIYSFGFTIFQPPGTELCFPLMHTLPVGFDISVAKHLSDNKNDGREINRFDTIEKAHAALSSNTQMNLAFSFDHNESRVEKQLHCFLSDSSEHLDGVVIYGQSAIGKPVGSGSIFRRVK